MTRTLLALAFTTLVLGCAPTVVEPTLSSIQAEIFTPRCAFAGCHNADDVGGGLSLAEGESHANLVGVVPTYTDAAVAGFFRVAPEDPDSSFLLTILGPDFWQYAASRMPAGNQDPLTEEELEAVREWVVLGAKDD